MNHYVPHVKVLPEDGATRELVLGFVQHPGVSQHRVQVFHVARGWRKVVQKFKEVHVSEMQRYPDRCLILVLDFDNDAGRLDEIRTEIPPDLLERVNRKQCRSSWARSKRSAANWLTTAMKAAMKCGDTSPEAQLV